MPDLSFGEILIVLAAALILFGPGRIGETAKALGKSIGAFKQGLREGADLSAKNPEPPKAQDPPRLPPV